MPSLRRVLPFAIAGAFILVFGSCTASQPPLARIEFAGALPGFWKGLWHGFIAPVTFVVSLFAEDLRIYAFPNKGLWYDFGFMIGISGFSGGVFHGSRKTKTE